MHIFYNMNYYLRSLSCILIWMRMSKLLDFMDNNFVSMLISTQIFSKIVNLKKN